VTTPGRYVFGREFGSRHGELRRDSAGILKPVAKAYLNKEGWLMYGNGGWLMPGSFDVQRDPILPTRVSLSLSQILTQSMREAQRLLCEQRFSAAPRVGHQSTHQELNAPNS
jgi:hypothetical protein